MCGEGGESYIDVGLFSIPPDDVLLVFAQFSLVICFWGLFAANGFGAE